jgi:hypothetical protein
MKKATKLEADVRDQLRVLWGGAGRELKWIEQARGGTVGAPDVLLPSPAGLSLPVELKCWKYWQGQCYFEARPAQIVYHNECASAGIKTAFIIGMKTDLEELYAFPGHLCPRRRSWNAVPFSKMRQLPKGKDAIQALIFSNEFWRIS